MNNIAGLYVYPAVPNPTTKMFTIATENTVYPGYPVVLSSGKIAVAASGQSSLVGIAAGYGTAGQTIPVWVADDKTTFFIKSKAGSVAVTAIGSTYDLDLTSDVYTIDTSSSTQNLFLVLGKHPRESWGATDAIWLEVKIVVSQVEQ